MKKIIILAGILLINLVGVAQENPQKDPDEQIIVNKKYDDQGNLIQYDSTYVHQWSSDSTFQYGFPGDSLFSHHNLGDLESFLNDFINDSAFHNFAFPNEPFSMGFRFSPFGDEEFQQNLPPDFSDSLMIGGFPFAFDSLFLNFDSTFIFPPGFDQKSFEDYFSREFVQPHKHSFPDFDNPERMKEWQEMMKRHRQEIEEFRRKWSTKND